MKALRQPSDNGSYDDRVLAAANELRAYLETQGQPALPDHKLEQVARFIVHREAASYRSAALEYASSASYVNNLMNEMVELGYYEK